MPEKRGAAQDRVSRVRDQLGAAFLLLSCVFVAGTVEAAGDPHRTYMSHGAWWWVGCALVFDLLALTLANVPWVLQAVFQVPSRGPLQDTKLAFFAVVGFASALAAADAILLQAGWGDWFSSIADLLLVSAVAPSIGVPLALRKFRGKRIGLVPLLPMAYYFNVLFIAWAGRFLVPVVMI